ncbi:MFS transporter [Streptacidiphilus sp. N1-3]|uniref:MFS transporter n=1 Tax=Streptacidiphilus alkalitolerans TaxID=3342712 RepID=A0ABV6XAV4_9ACTN
MTIITAPLEPASERHSIPRAQRRLLSRYFSAAGAVMAVWGSRLPSVQDHLHLGAGGLSLGLLGAAAGMVGGLQIGGRIADRLSAAFLLRPAAVALGAGLALLGLPGSLVPFVAVCAAFGLAHGLLDLALNTSAARCQAGFGRPIMSSLHARYSLGALAGAGAAALAAHIGISAETTFAATALVLAAVVIACGQLKPLPPIAAPAGEARAGRPALVVILLGGLALCSLLGEGAAGDWAAVHLHSSAHASTAVAATAYACYSGSMALCRLAGDRIAGRLGPVLLLRVGGLIAALGLGLGLALDRPVPLLIGWAMFGLGLSPVIPAVFTASAAVDPTRTGRDVALTSGIGYLGMIAGPALIGALAQLASLTAALALPALLALVVAGTAGMVRPLPLV